VSTMRGSCTKRDSQPGAFQDSENVGINTVELSEHTGDCDADAGHETRHRLRGAVRDVHRGKHVLRAESAAASNTVLGQVTYAEDGLCEIGRVVGGVAAGRPGGGDLKVVQRATGGVEGIDDHTYSGLGRVRGGRRVLRDRLCEQQSVTKRMYVGVKTY
jgi:hypothetical protein